MIRFRVRLRTLLHMGLISWTWIKDGLRLNWNAGGGSPLKILLFKLIVKYMRAHIPVILMSAVHVKALGSVCLRLWSNKLIEFLPSAAVLHGRCSTEMADVKASSVCLQTSVTYQRRWRIIIVCLPLAVYHCRLFFFSPFAKVDYWKTHLIIQSWLLFIEKAK